jgi:hypothetical protein
LAIESLAHLNGALVFSGIKFTYFSTPFGMKIKRILVNGREINPFKSYSVALTEGVVLGASGMGKITQAILRFPKKSPYRIWSTLEEKLISSGNSLKLNKITNENHVFVHGIDY